MTKTGDTVFCHGIPFSVKMPQNPKFHWDINRLIVRDRNTVVLTQAGLVDLLFGMGAFYINFSITSPEFIIFL